MLPKSVADLLIRTTDREPNRAVTPLRLTLAAAVSLGTIWLGATAAAQTKAPDLTSAWPGGSAVAEIRGRDVTYPSHSPFVIADVGRGAEDDPPTPARARLFLPKGASARRQAPAVILLHGASGVSDRREMTYARQFAAMGVAALVVDVFGARRDKAAGFISRIMNITEAMALADAYAGLRYLAALPQVDGRRVALIGFSYGGMVTTYAVYEMVAKRFARNGERFAGHVAFYGPCIATFRDNRTTGAPLLMLYGGKDGIMDTARCKAVARELEDGGTRVRTVVYPNAYHKWDGAWGGPYRIGRTLAPCRFTVGRDGSVYGGRLMMPMTNSFTRKLILGLCAGSDGYLIGRDDKVRAKSNREMGRFLQRVFSEGRAE